MCLTLDVWTSKSKKAILVVNLRWLDQDFKRYQHYIEFIEIQGSYSGENLAQLVYKALKEYDYCERLLTITSDNTSNNDTLCQTLYELLLKEFDDYLDIFPTRGKTMRFRGEASRIRYFAHILNLIVKAILTDLGSSTQKQAMEFLDYAAVDITNRTRIRITLLGAQNSIAKLRIIILWIHRSAQRVQE